MKQIISVAAFVLVGILSSYSQARNSKLNRMNSANEEVITLGAGCFWCVEAVFERINGVSKVVSGYSGGKISNPTYREVCSGLTGHAEVVQVTFNPQVVALETILEVFFKTHDPTTLNRQGADVGSQYRSAIFYHNEQQKQTAQRVVVRLKSLGIWAEPIVTEVTAFDKFYRAEDYHQDYFANNRTQTYCQAVINPKVAKLESAFKDLLKEKYRKNVR